MGATARHRLAGTQQRSTSCWQARHNCMRMSQGLLHKSHPVDSRVTLHTMFVDTVIAFHLPAELVFYTVGVLGQTAATLRSESEIKC